jgi:hypothetical protein
VRLGLIHKPGVPSSWLVIVYEKRRDRERENYRDRGFVGRTKHVFVTRDRVRATPQGKFHVLRILKTSI